MNKYLPTLPRLSQEVIVTLAAAVIVGIIYAKVPRLRDFVRGTTSTPTQ